MRYSILGTTGLKVSCLGFGCMRLPMRDGKVNRAEAFPLLRYALKKGVTFFDTAIGYCNGDSQAAVGEALENVRDRVILSTKNHHHTKTPSEWRRALEESLRHLRTDYIDLYNHHGVTWDIYKKFLDPSKNGLTAEMFRARQEGLIRHVGFSFHDSPQNLFRLIDTGHYETMIVQYNLLDQTNAQAMKYAAGKGMGVIVMGPVGGGRLGIENEKINSLVDAQVSSTAEAALRFVWGHSAVNVALSGMQNEKMLDENISCARTKKPFTDQQIAVLNSLVAERKKKSGLYCSGCGYCVKGCPAGIDIPLHLELLQLEKIFGLTHTARNRYRKIPTPVEECIRCGKCVTLCPQNIQIPEKLREAAVLLDDRCGGFAAHFSTESVSENGPVSLNGELTNLSNVTKDVDIILQPHNSSKFSHREFHIPSIPPFGKKNISIEVQNPAPRSTIHFGGTLKAGPLMQTFEKKFNYLLVRYQPTTVHWYSVGAEAKDFMGDTILASRHSFEFALGYTEECLTVDIRVTDDFLFPSQRKKHAGSAVDSVELYFDCRSSRRIGMRGYEKNVYQILLYPGTPGRYNPFYHVKGGMPLRLEADGTEYGYALSVQIPFISLGYENTIPQKMGFDIGVNSANEKGKRVGQYFFNGGPDNFQDPSEFAELWLV